MKPVLDPVVLDQLFREAHTFNKFADRPVAEQTVRDLYALLKWGPTSMNAQPGRYVFLHSATARERLVPAMIAAKTNPASGPANEMMICRQPSWISGSAPGGRQSRPQSARCESRSAIASPPKPSVNS